MKFFKNKIFTSIVVGVLTVAMVAIYVPMFFVPKVESPTPTPTVAPVNQATPSAISNPTSTSQSQNKVVAPTQIEPTPQSILEPTPPPPVTGGKSLEELQKILNH